MVEQSEAVGLVERTLAVCTSGLVALPSVAAAMAGPVPLLAAAELRVVVAQMLVAVDKVLQ